MLDKKKALFNGKRFGKKRSVRKERSIGIVQRLQNKSTTIYVP